MPTIEQLQDPTYAFEVGGPLADRLGVAYDPSKQPLAYNEAMYQANPRRRGGGGTLIRFDLEGSTSQYDPQDETLIHETAEQLGVKAEEYPFPEGADYDTIVVAGGARNAQLDRGMFVADALASGLIRARQVLVIGDGRRVSDKERSAIQDWAPHAQTSGDMAEAAVNQIRAGHPELFEDVALRALHLQTKKPNQRQAVEEVILREGIRKGGSMAVATTALYAPFKIHDSQAAGTRLGVKVDVAGVRSRPEVVAARTTDTYLAENTQTLASAANHYNSGRGIKW